MCSDRIRARGRLLATAAAVVSLVAPGIAPGAPVQEAVDDAGTPAQPLFYPDDPVWVDPDDGDIEKPAEAEIGKLAYVMNTVGSPVVDPRLAVNINTLGEVPHSSWFQNRSRREQQVPDDAVPGPDAGRGPPAPGRWKVVGHPGAGYTPKLTIEDPEGRRYLLKFEDRDNPRMRSAAEVVCTNLFHAFGYNVPSNHIVTFDPENLYVDPELETGDIPAPDLETMLVDTPRTPDGQVRALASSWLAGEPVGPFLYEGTRDDDPNDVFPHQHRRELRGLKVFAAWLNHTDIKQANTLDMYVEQDGRRFVRHHLIDFGSCLGSGAVGPKHPMVGYERYIDAGGILKGVFTFGLWSHSWAEVDYPDHPSVGTFEGDFYQPWRWKEPIPTSAFMHMDAADAFWAARIVARFDDEAVATAVAAARYADPEQERHVLETLLKRRDKSVAYWLTRTNPLDEFRVEAAALAWDNAVVRHGVATEPSAYEVRWYRLDNESGERHAIATGGRDADPVAGDSATDAVDSRTTAAAIPADPWGPEDRFGLRYTVAEISTRHPDYPWWASPVTVTLRLGGDGAAEVVGVRRPREMPPEPEG